MLIMQLVTLHFTGWIAQVAVDCLCWHFVVFSLSYAADAFATVFVHFFIRSMILALILILHIFLGVFFGQGSRPRMWASTPWAR